MTAFGLRSWWRCGYANIGSNNTPNRYRLLNRRQQMVENNKDTQDQKGKKVYLRPEVKNWGAVVDMTAAQGMTFLTDAAMTGSMADMGMGGM